jgi:hypothetical protein
VTTFIIALVSLIVVPLSIEPIVKRRTLRRKF